jgi:acyl-coenzyme A thioesterase PaaI-like protein
MRADGPSLLRLWRRCQRLPGGRRLFSRLLRARVPYSGSIRPLVLELAPGQARVAMPDRRALRNHLGSVHAIALANLGELASGLALLSALPAGVRGIVVHLGISYLKKARGPLVATGYAIVPAAIDAPMEHEVVAELADETLDVVATVTVRWRLAPAGTR